MKFTITRENLLKTLQQVAGVVERRQTMPVLANILMIVKKQRLTLVGTDLEVELRGFADLEQVVEVGEITVSARKLTDICRVLPEQTKLELFMDGAKLIVRSGRSRFSLVTVPANEFPNTEGMTKELEFSIPQPMLRKFIEDTSFAMAQQDVRPYLNGMLFEVGSNHLRGVATDGHRMAFNHVDVSVAGMNQIIIPRKAVGELARLLEDTGDAVIAFGTGQLCVKTDSFTFTSKLIDGKYPSYEKVISKGGDRILVMERDSLKQALSRVATLVNENHRGIRFELQTGLLRIVANNLNQEEAEEELNVEYQGEKVDVGFNVNYLLDAINTLPAGNIKLVFSNPDGCVHIQEFNGDGKSSYVVMPMRL